MTPVKETIRLRAGTIKPNINEDRTNSVWYPTNEMEKSLLSCGERKRYAKEALPGYEQRELGFDKLNGMEIAGQHFFGLQDFTWCVKVLQLPRRQFFLRTR